MAGPYAERRPGLHGIAEAVAPHRAAGAHATGDEKLPGDLGRGVVLGGGEEQLGVGVAAGRVCLPGHEVASAFLLLRPVAARDRISWQRYQT